MGGDGGAHEGPLGRERLAVAVVEAPQQRGRSLDVAEEHCDRAGGERLHASIRGIDRERTVLGEHRRLERPRLLARFEAELVCEELRSRW